jgi:hypothetical protein
VLLALAAAFGGACTAHPPAEVKPAPQDSSWVIVDADSHGVVLLGASSGAPDVLRGVDRSGNRAWERDDLAPSLPAVVCLVHCPVAVASSGTVSDREVPTTVLGEKAAGVAFDAKATVLSAPGQAVVQESHSSRGAVTLTLASGVARKQLTINGVRTTWRPSNDNRSAIALVGDAAGSTYAVRTFRRESAWEPTAWAGTSSTLFGCTGSDGRRVVVSDPQPVLVNLQDGGKIPIRGLESGGDCAFAGETVMVAQYALRETGHHSVLVVTDMAGEALWRQEFEEEIRIRADLGGKGFLTLPPGKAEERDSRGTLLQSVDDVSDARYDENGDIVLVDGSGTVRWAPSRSRAVGK